MKLMLLAGFCAAALCVGAQAQSRDQDYADLLLRATGQQVRERHSGNEMGWPEQERILPSSGSTSAPVASPSSEPSYSRVPAGMYDALAGGEVSGPDYFNDPADYANEPHRVRVVDRSRYDEAFLPATLANTMGIPAGAILVDTKARQLYVGLDARRVRRYGVAVGREGSVWRGTAVVGRKAQWPDWRPTENIRKENPKLPELVKGSASNPLGARAIYLYQNGQDTLYRIHGTNAPRSIGTYASHGCIRMINEDVIELYDLVRQGAPVIVR